MEYKLDKFSSGQLESLTDLLNLTFHIKNQDKKKLVNWKFFDRVHQQKSITYLALDDVQVVGQYSNLPISVSQDSHIFKSMLCVDMATHPDHRGKGLISKLSQKVYDEVRAQGFDFTIGFSNDNGVQVDKNSSSYGYQVLGKFARYFKPVFHRKKTSILLEKISKFPEHDQFVPTSHFFKVHKSSEYLNWRYVEKPNETYDIYRILDSQKKNLVMGYVVLRFVGRKCYVLDLIVQDLSKENFLQIIYSIQNVVYERGAALTIYNVLDTTFWQTIFSRFKYFKKTTSAYNFYLTIKIHNPQMLKTEILFKDNWFLMNGDIL